jgi:hypothetical protein
MGNVLLENGGVVLDVKRSTRSPMKSLCVCRGVLRVWGSRIQDSRTDFEAFWRNWVPPTSTRGWCKMETCSGDLVWVCKEMRRRWKYRFVV